MVAYIALILGLLAVVSQAAQAQSLVLDQAQSLPGMWAGRAVWGDYDNDSDADLILIGEIVTADGTCTPVTRLFRNEGGLLAEDLTQTGQLLGVYFGDAGWADYDNDGDLDLAVVGWDGEGLESLRLYQNESGAGLQWDPGHTGLTGVRYAHLAWADYDNDGDPDLLITGMEEIGNSLTRLYRNDGGRLQLDQANSEILVNVHDGEAAWGDYDNDGDLDLAVSGQNVSVSGGLGAVSEFYRNEPTGTLKLDRGLSLANQVKGGSVAWGDYDGDGNIDLALSGRDNFWNGVLEVYRNRPLGVLVRDERFTLPVTQRVAGSVAWADYDNDGSLDLAVSGRSILSDYQAFVFGGQAGVLSPISSESALVGLAGGNIAWADYNGDGRLDLVNTGVDQQGVRRTQLYGNLGTLQANFPPQPPIQLNAVQVTSQRALFSWAPGSDLESETLAYHIRVGTESGRGDILGGTLGTEPANTGFKTSRFLERELAPDTYFWSVRAVDGSGQVSAWSQEQTLLIQQFISSEQRLTSLTEAAMAWGDYDNDGDADLVMSGFNRSGAAQTIFYDNQAGQLSVEADAGLAPLKNGDAAWGDYDNDGDLDLVLTGTDAFDNAQSWLYRTDRAQGQADFALVGGFAELSSGVARWGDYDNDGDLDLLQMGQSGEAVGGLLQSQTLLYANDGAGGFALAGVGLEGVNNGEAAWADGDGDGDVDLAVSGISSQGVPRLDYYRNDAGQLVDAQLGLPGLHSSDLAWGDYDGDGRVDLVAGGINEAGGFMTRIFHNEGNGPLRERSGDPFPGIQGGDLAWGDYDNDQDLDLVVAGNDGQQAVYQIFENQDGSFVQDLLQVLQPVDFSAVSLADYDGDGDVDLVSAGRFGGVPNTAVNDNLEGQFNANRPPAAVDGLVASDSGDAVLLTWSPASDDGSPPPTSLTYQVRVGTQTAGGQILSGAAGLGPGNAGHTPFMPLKDLASGTYFWSVRTVDHGAALAEWSAEQSFVIDTVAPQVDTLVTSRQQAGIGQAVSLALSFTDIHAGIDVAAVPTVNVIIGEQTYPFTLLQFTGSSWSGELSVSADMPSGPVAVAVSGVADGKQNEMAPFRRDGVFVIDTQLPAVLTRVPAAGAVGVELGIAAIEIGFSEALEATTVSTDNFRLVLGQESVELLALPGLDEATNTVQLLPAGGLQPGSQYSVEVSAAIQDLAGNRPDDALAWSFSTQIPQLVETRPAVDAERVALADARISAVFDAPLLLSQLDDESVQIRREGSLEPLREAPQFDAATMTLSAVPEGGLKVGSRYEVVIAGWVAGPLRVQQSGDFRWQFQTVVPQVVGVVPDSAAQGVDTGLSEASVDFNVPIDEEQRTAANFILLDNGAPVALRQGDPVDRGDGVYGLAPVDGWQVGSTYSVQVAPGVTGPQGTDQAISWQFQTVVPQLIGQVPEPGDRLVASGLTAIEAVFDAAIDQEALRQAGVVQVLAEGQTVEIGEPAYNLDSGAISFAPVDGLKAGTSYQVVLGNALGGALQQDNYQWTFKTAVPELVGSVPVDASIVTVDLPEVSVAFSVPIDEEQRTAANFALLENGALAALRQGDPVDLGAGVYGLAPVDGWQVGSTYSVQIAPAVTGPQGTDQPVSWQFQTAVPQVVSRHPASGDESVSTLEPTIEVVFDAAIDQEALRQAGVVQVLAEGQAVEIGEPAYNPDSGAISFAPVGGLKAGTSYQVVLGNALGGALQQDNYQWRFATAVPGLIGSFPAEGSTVEVALSEATVSFSVPIDEDQRTAANFALLQDGEAVALRQGDPVDLGAGGYGLAPVDGWQVGSTYSVQIAPGVTGPQGTDQPISWQFQTAVPQVVSQQPAPGDESVSTLEPTIAVAFDAAIDQEALRQAGAVQVLAEGQAVEIGEPAYNAGTQTLSFAPLAGLRAGTRYRISLASALGGPGRQEAGDFIWNFSTRVPGLERTVPAARAEGVPMIPGLISVVFTDRVASQNAADFQLLSRALGSPQVQSELVPISPPSTDSTGTLISFSPTDGLQAFTEYEVRVGQQVLGPLAEIGFSWIFRTAAQLADSDRGGRVSNVAKTVELYFPPKALQDGGNGEVAIRTLQEDPDMAVPAGATQIGSAYQLEFPGGEAVLIKPLTLTLRYSAAELGGREAARLAIYRLGGSGWERLGGTPQPDSGLVRTTVDRLATFALFEDLQAPVGDLHIADLDCQPRSFNPQEEAVRGQTDISFTLTGPTDLNVQVYNASGRLERIIARDRPLAAGRHALTWDGRDEDRQVVSSGLYIVVVRGGDVRREKVVAVVR